MRYEFGKLLEPKIIGHMEYFYNTLNASVETQNPFNEPAKYAAFEFKEQADPDMSDIDDLIDQTEVNLTPLPNHKSREVEFSPVKESINDELKKQSIVLVKGMSILDKHNLIVDPMSFQNKMRVSVLSGQSMMKSGSSIGGLSSKNIQQIVRNSVCQMLPPDQWYPNLNITSKPTRNSFQGSPVNKEKLRKASVRVDANPALINNPVQQNMSAGPKFGLQVVNDCMERSDDSGEYSA